MTVPRIVSEADLEREFQIAAKLGSVGDFGCTCAAVDRDTYLTVLGTRDAL